ncbi:MAG: helix-turn-helix transcriptional regulator [Desulfotignum sp.]|nr:helix-turn-helix transcriptional regulator [Desulfotignum sp.]
MTIKEKYGLKEIERDYGPLTFGKALWSHRKCEEMTQKEFAKLLGIAPSSLCDLEKGRKIPSPDRAAKIARKIGMSEKTWVRLAIQDMLRAADLEYTVSVA